MGEVFVDRVLQAVAAVVVVCICTAFRRAQGGAQGLRGARIRLGARRMMMAGLSEDRPNWTSSAIPKISREALVL